MIKYFIIALFVTLVVVRVAAYALHDRQGYGTRGETSKTPTGWLRRTTGFDWHHAHLGMVLVFISLCSIVLVDLTKSNLVFFAIGLSLVLDQIVPLVNKRVDYFDARGLITSIGFHIVAALISVGVYLRA